MAARPCRVRPLDPFGVYLLRRWEDGCRSPTDLWRELQSQGFTGSRSAVRRHLARSLGVPLSALPRRSRGEGQRPALQPPAPRAVVWLLLGKSRQTPLEADILRALLESSGTVSRARELVLEFERLVGGRRENDLAG
ncbi:MAG TPA: hypothetical protein VGN26_12100 [Armatimonadota bacterium]